MLYYVYQGINQWWRLLNIDFNGTPINRNYETEVLEVLKDVRAKIL